MTLLLWLLVTQRWVPSNAIPYGTEPTPMVVMTLPAVSSSVTLLLLPLATQRWVPSMRSRMGPSPRQWW